MIAGSVITSRSPASGERDEPDHHHRPEEAAHRPGAEALDREQHREHREGDGHHQVGQPGRRDLHPLDRREHRDGRRDDAVAVEERGAEDAEQDEPAGVGAGPLDQRREGHDPALAVVVGAQDEDHVLDRDDQRDGPEDERDHAVDVGVGRLHHPAVQREDGLEGVERAGPDVAEYDAQGPQHETHLARLRDTGAPRRVVFGFGHSVPGNRRAREVSVRGVRRITARGRIGRCFAIRCRNE